MNRRQKVTLTQKRVREETSVLIGDTVTFSFDSGLFLVICALIGIILASGLMYVAMRMRGEIAELPEGRQLEAIAGASVLLAPVWLALLWAVLEGIWTIYSTFPSPGGEGPTTDLRWHALAFVGLLTALAGLLGTPLALIRVWTTERQVKTAEEGLITDRINKAVEGLGTEKRVDRIGRPVTFVPNKELSGLTHSAIASALGDPFYARRTEIEWLDDGLNWLPYEVIESQGNWQVFSNTKPNLEVRFGAIFTLEVIAKNSPAYQGLVRNILAAYIRENARTSCQAEWKRWRQRSLSTLERPLPENVRSHLATIESDIATSLKTIAKISNCHINNGAPNQANKEDWLELKNLSLESLDLTHLTLQNLDASRSELNFSNLGKNQFIECRLYSTAARSCFFDGSRFSYIDLTDANFQFSQFILSEFNKCTFTGSKFDGASFLGTRFSNNTVFDIGSVRGACLKSVDMSSVKAPGNILDQTFGDASVTLPADIRKPEHWPQEEMSYEAFSTAWRDWQAEHHADLLPLEDPRFGPQVTNE